MPKSPSYRSASLRERLDNDLVSLSYSVQPLKWAIEPFTVPGSLLEGGHAQCQNAVKLRPNVSPVGEHVEAVRAERGSHEEVAQDGGDAQLLGHGRHRHRGGQEHEEVAADRLEHRLVLRHAPRRQLESLSCAQPALELLGHLLPGCDCSSYGIIGVVGVRRMLGQEQSDRGANLLDETNFSRGLFQGAAGVC